MSDQSMNADSFSATLWHLLTFGTMQQFCYKGTNPEDIDIACISSNIYIALYILIL